MKVICPPKCTSVSDDQSFTKSGLRHRPVSHRDGRRDSSEVAMLLFSKRVREPRAMRGGKGGDYWERCRASRLTAAGAGRGALGANPQACARRRPAGAAEYV